MQSLARRPVGRVIVLVALLIRCQGYYGWLASSSCGTLDVLFKTRARCESARLSWQTSAREPSWFGLDVLRVTPRKPALRHAGFCAARALPLGAPALDEARRLGSAEHQQPVWLGVLE